MGDGLLIRMGDLVLEMRSDTRASVYYLKKTSEKIVDQSAIEKKFQFPPNGFLWYTDRLKTEEGTGTGRHRNMRCETQERFKTIIG